MDTVKFIIGILIFIIGIASEVKKRSRKRNEARQLADFKPLPTTPPVPPTPKPQPAPMPHIHPEIKHQPAVFEEGTRVTRDEQPSLPDSTDHTSSNPDSQAEDLRRRIIWGEILSRKF